MSTEIPREEQIEAARARLKTAYDRMQDAPTDLKESCRMKWEERKRELEILLTPQSQQL